MIRADSLLTFGKKSKTPVILQSENTECALSCLAMVACHHGYETDINRLRQRFSVSSQGTGLRQLMVMCEQLNLISRPVKIELDHIHQLECPCIIHWEMNHFVVLEAVKKDTLIIIDPAVGKRHISLSEADHFFTGVALEITPSARFEKKKDRIELRLTDFWQRIVGLKRSLIHLFLLALFLQIFAIFTPFYLQLIVDDVILKNDRPLLMALAIGFGLLLAAQTGVSILRELVVIQLSHRMNIQMSANLFRHLIRIPTEYFSKRHIGDTVSRFNSLHQIRELFTSGIVTIIIDGLLAILTLLVMLYYSVTLTVIVLFFIFCYVIFRLQTYAPLRRVTEENLIAQAKHDSHFLETIRAIQTIKIFERENDRQSQWQNVLATAINKKIIIDRLNLKFNSVNQVLFGAENIIVILFAAQLVMSNVFSVGMLYAFIAYKSRFTTSINALVSQWIAIKMLSVHLERLADITTQTTEGHSKALTDNETPINGKIDIAHISYRFSELEKPLFSDISFTINAGETVVITGPSGSGKSTLLRCLMGLTALSEGEILIDNQPIGSLAHYRSNIGAVMQDDQLLSGSISENIAFFCGEMNMDRVHMCANLAAIHDEIIRMPMGYNTLVGDMGSSLSGGQKQRIILARALYRGPKILFLDEATSHLDVATEAIVNGNIARLNITRVMVAHRPETIRSADREIALANLL